MSFKMNGQTFLGEKPTKKRDRKGEYYPYLSAKVRVVEKPKGYKVELKKGECFNCKTLTYAYQHITTVDAMSKGGCASVEF